MDLFLRFLWTFSLIPVQALPVYLAKYTDVWMIAVLAFAEIFRRSMWGCFRCGVYPGLAPSYATWLMQLMLLMLSMLLMLLAAVDAVDTVDAVDAVDAVDDMMPLMLLMLLELFRLQLPHLSDVFSRFELLFPVRRNLHVIHISVLAVEALLSLITDFPRSCTGSSGRR